MTLEISDPRLRRLFEYERLIRPLSSDDETINMFLTGAVGFGYG